LKPTAVILISVLLAALRIAGIKHEAFQAIAHLWVGGLCGGFALGRYWRVGGYRLFAWLVVILSIIEVACFLKG
jgi:hypothetical protein